MHGFGEAMKYLSLFSGIEAASVAWHPLGWQPVAFAEIEPFPSAVLQYRFPSVPNWGDVSKFKEWPDVCNCNPRNADWQIGESRPTGSRSELRGSDVHPEYGGQTRSGDYCGKCGGMYEPIDLIVGGSPCQAFSVAGLRKGLDDPRGNLSLTYLAIVEKYLPEWIVWENVPGVLSSSGGRDFAAFLGALDALGYGYAWRVLDAQYVRTPDYPRAVPQRRRRVFVVGNRRGWQRAAAVLFDSESVCGNPPPSREKRQGFTSASSEGIGGEGGNGSELALYDEVNLTSPLNRQNRNSQSPSHTLNTEAGRSLLVNSPIVLDRAAYSQGENARYPPYIEETDLMPALVSRGPHAIAHAFKIRGGSETETGEQGGTPGKKAGKGDLGSDETAVTVASSQDQQVAIAYETNPTDARVSEIKDGVGPTVKARWGTGGNNQALVQQVTYERHDQDGRIKEVEISPTIHSKSDNACDLPLVQQVAAMRESGQGYWMEDEIAGTLRAEGEDRPSRPSHVINSPIVQNSMAVRRLTPVECERLQGFPDGWTQIPWRKKPAEDCPDGPRYKAIGNSMAVNVMQWIGLRIAMFEEIAKDLQGGRRSTLEPAAASADRSTPSMTDAGEKRATQWEGKAAVWKRRLPFREVIDRSPDLI